MFAKLLSKRTIESQPEIVALVKSMMQTVSPATVSAAQNAMAERRDFTDQLPAIRVPTLVVAGESDVIAPAADAQVWASKIPNASIAVIPHTAHLSPLEDPTTFNQTVVKFIGTVG